jgi:microcystin degradation protein MlrC
MRIAIGSLLQETNTFSPQLTKRADFQIHHGPDLIRAAEVEETEVHGFIDVLRRNRAEIVPLVGGWAVSSGRMVRKDFQGLVEELLDALRAAGPVDGVLLALHGAWAAEGIDSADGYVLEQVRSIVGDRIPIVTSLDLHASLARSMARSADAIVGYRTCPHVDTADTGRRAAELMVAAVSGKRRLKMSVRKLRLVTQAEEMISDRGVFKELLDHALQVEQRPGVLSASLFPCQPWLDVEELGWASVVVTDDDTQLARRCADELAEALWSRRHDFVVDLPDVDQALDRAMRVEGGPITLGEGADGTMGGSPGDSVHILAGILKRGLGHVPTAAVTVDPAAVAQAIAAGVGQTITLSVGGKLNPAYSTPLTVTGRVKLISDGEFYYKGSCYTGRRVQMGRSVVLQVNAVNLLIGERSMPTTDPEMYRSQGIEPRDMKLVLCKSPLSFRMDYEPISKAVMSVDTPGCCRADLTKLPFVRVPRPMFPFDPIQNSITTSLENT